MSAITSSDVKWQWAEGALVFACALAALYVIGPAMAWWGLLLVFFAPDLSFLAYLAGPKVGSIFYNLVHIYGFGAVIAALGVAMQSDLMLVCGILWIGHSGFDRMLGYGLKRPDSFKSTHMGEL